jgi:hypothetical protein
LVVQLLTEGTLQMIAWTKGKMAIGCAAALLLTTGAITVSIQHARAIQRHADLQHEHLHGQVETRQTMEADRLAILEEERIRF